jgi:hypothetical protein
MQIWGDGMADAGDAENKAENLQRELDDPVKNIIGPAFGALLVAILTGLFSLTFHFADVIGWALTSLIWFAEITFIGWLAAMFIQYFGDLGAGADTIGSRRRRAYDTLREDLKEGGRPAILYARWLPAFLDAVDRFFGDAGMADRTLFHHMFWLKTPAPLWTAPAFELCLLLALIYPTATIFIIWAISGHVGPAELALHLDPGLREWQRWLAAALTLLSVFALWAGARKREWKRVILIIGSIVAFVVAMAISVASARAMTIAGATPAASSAGYFRQVRVAGVGSSHPAIAVAVVLLGTITVAVTIAVLGAVLGAIRRSSQTGGRRWEGILLFFIFVAMLFGCYGAPIWLSSLQMWQILGPLLLFLGLLTLLNAPFDWASLGLTRALLRRGLELGGLWPYGLALVDAAFAAVIIAALALAMVLGVQLFDALAVRGGGASVLPLEPLLTGIAAHPTAPEYWWLYALLLSTMIPSLVNLVIGGTAFVRGLPVLPALLLRSIPEGEAIPIGNRFGVALVLTGQLAIGFLMGMAAQLFLVVYIISYIMPFFGLELLDMARGVAAFNLPARAGHLFGVSL